MLSMGVITALSILILLAPPTPLAVLLELMSLPTPARLTLLLSVVVNVVVSMVFEQWGTQVVAEVIGLIHQIRRSRRRVRDGKTYKIVEGGMGGS